MVGRKPILSICRTCREPKMGGKFNRHANGIRHDNCKDCEREIKATKAAIAKEPKVVVKKTTTVVPQRVICKPIQTTIATHWIGGYQGERV